LLFILFIGCQQWVGAQIKNSSNPIGTLDRKAQAHLFFYPDPINNILVIVGLVGTNIIKIGKSGNNVLTTQDSQVHIDYSTIQQGIYDVYVNDIRVTRFAKMH